MTSIDSTVAFLDFFFSFADAVSEPTTTVASLELDVVTASVVLSVFLDFLLDFLAPSCNGMRQQGNSW